jgi:uncharacterized protein YeaO (DUF488 family)
MSAVAVAQLVEPRVVVPVVVGSSPTGHLRRAGDGARMEIRAKRVYDPPADDDGYRVLVDRLWPRGLGREEARVDEWARDLAPSHGLRRWFGHRRERFPELARRYREELATREEALERLLRRAGRGPLTLLFAARDRERNNAVVLAEVLRDRGAPSPAGDRAGPRGPGAY